MNEATVKTYSILFAQDVPHYGSVEIEAENVTAALNAAKAYDLSDVTNNPEWENSVCKRIVHIEDSDGNTVHHDIPLDDYFLRCGSEKDRLLCDAAPEMRKALELCGEVLSDLARLDHGTPSVTALNMTRDALAKANGGTL